MNLICPVCDRSEITTSICPNCETNLSTYKLLVNLSEQPILKAHKKVQVMPLWLPICIAILFLCLGLGMGFTSNSLIAKQANVKQHAADLNHSVSQAIAQPPKVDLADTSQLITKAKFSSCSGFEYTVRPGDSLSLIAAHLYGDSHFWSVISQANPAIQGREKLLEIGSKLIVPNLNSNC